MTDREINIRNCLALCAVRRPSLPVFVRMMVDEMKVEMAEFDIQNASKYTARGLLEEMNNDQIHSVLLKICKWMQDNPPVR